MQWQGNAESVKYRAKLVSYSLRDAIWNNQLFIPDKTQPDETPTYRAFYRASGRMVCGLCGLTYTEHPLYPFMPAWPEGMPNDYELCNGDIVHL